jgi:CHAT domain-containing protein
MTAETLPHQARAKRATDQFVITFELSVSLARRKLMQSLARTRRSLVAPHAKAERRATAQRLYDIALSEAAGRYVRACDERKRLV